MAPSRRPWYRILYVQVIIAVLIGVTVGFFWPDAGKSLKPLGDGFVKLVKMMIGPIIFCTVVHGIASVGDIKKLGRVGVKALFYFEVVSTLALIIGLVVVNVLKPGVGISFHADAAAVSASAGLSEKAHALSTTDFILNIIPNTFLGAFVTGVTVITTVDEHGTPRGVVNRLSVLVQSFMNTEDMKKRLASEGGDPVGSTPEAFGNLIKTEHERWGRVVKISGAKVD